MADNEKQKNEKQRKESKPVPKAVLIGAAVFVFLTVVWFLFGGRPDPQPIETEQNVTVSEDAAVYERVALKNIKRYERMKIDNAEEAKLCFQAGLISGSYEQAGNTAEYRKWEKVKEAECENVEARARAARRERR